MRQIPVLPKITKLQPTVLTVGLKRIASPCHAVYKIERQTFLARTIPFTFKSMKSVNGHKNNYGFMNNRFNGVCFTVLPPNLTKQICNIIPRKFFHKACFFAY